MTEVGNVSTEIYKYYYYHYPKTKGRYIRYGSFTRGYSILTMLYKCIIRFICQTAVMLLSFNHIRDPWILAQSSHAAHMRFQLSNFLHFQQLTLKLTDSIYFMGDFD